MKTEKELNAAILKITLHIQNTYPELCKYFEEMPITIPNPNPEISIKTLRDYYESLEIILKKYAASHTVEPYKLLES
jgi:hypothetical protein